MRKLAVLPAALMAAAVVAAPAAAQTSETLTEFTSKASISPKKAGTKKNPQGITLKGSMKMETLSQGVEPPIVTGGEVLIAKGGVWNGGKYKTCSRNTMDRSQSIDDCNPKSIIGVAKGVAFADTVNARPDVVLINGGKSTMWAFTTLYAPALVREPVEIKIKKLSGPKWGYRATFQVPEALQIVGGVPVTLRSLDFQVGGKFKLPGGPTVNAKKHAPEIIATTSCPRSNKYPYEAKAFYEYNDLSVGSDTHKGTVACS